MKIPESFIENQAFDANPLAFNRQLDLGLANPLARGQVPVGAKCLTDGSAEVTFYAPEAKAVSAGHDGIKIDLQKDEKGVWRGILPYPEPGFKQLEFKVDGTSVLNAMAPIGFGSNRPINYIEIPDTDCDYLLLKDVPHGTVSMEYFYSSVVGEYACCYVYTPPMYYKDTDKDYPVLYLQHGAGENETSWIQQGKTNFVMDNLIAQGKAEPFIIVMNNGMIHLKKDDEWVLDMNAVQDLIIKDCIPFIEEKYRVRPGKFNRAIAGLSMGSIQAARIIMERYDLFGAAGLFSGYSVPRLPGRVVQPQPWLDILDDAETFNREIPVFFGAVGDQEGSVPTFEEDRVTCREKGINYIQKIYPGSHEWRVWRAASHDFFQLIFK